jgi:RNA polymerase sigma-70 factor, ECF subfamily
LAPNRTNRRGMQDRIRLKEICAGGFDVMTNQVAALKAQGIMEHVRSGHDPELILNEIVEVFGRDLKNFSRYRCGNEADAEDAYQNALIAAHRYIGSFRGETPLKHWLLKLVTTACLQKKRGRKNDPKIHVAIDPKLHPEIERHLRSKEVPQDTQAIINEEKARLHEALEVIGEKDRKMLMMHHGDGVELSDIARDFRMSIPGVKTRLFRARVALRKYMEQRSGEAMAY